MLEYALAYAKRGWSTFPLHTLANSQCTCGQEQCARPGKHPLTLHGLRDATLEEATIRQWWRQWPSANIGVLTGRISGFWALDVDPRYNGHETLDRLVREHNEFPLTLKAATGGGGHHYLFRYPGRCRHE